ncbi:hypothetical protein TNCV_3957311 [Trichonephila clavipes]|nr:hypothetical protein TNCV_3957311 [Trichonephila clavipes]
MTRKTFEVTPISKLLHHREDFELHRTTAPQHGVSLIAPGLANSRHAGHECCPVSYTAGIPFGFGLSEQSGIRTVSGPN